ncbi:MAG: penicillin-binding protein 2, partial [Bdellovibrio sp.]
MNTHLHVEQDNVKTYSERFRLFNLILFLSAFIITARLWYLQIIQGQDLRAYSEKNHVKQIKLRAPRGLFLDREGRILVENIQGYSVVISPQYASQLKKTAQVLSQILHIPASKIIRKVKKSRYQNGPFRTVKIKENISLDEVREILKVRLDNPGLDIEKVILRSYPLGENGAQVFGYVGEISKPQIKEYNKKFKGQYIFQQGDIIGKRGLEKVWEAEIR